MAENFQPLFVGGSGRSGTTIAINLLNNHSQIHSSLPREVKYLTSRFGLIDLVFGRPLDFEEGLTGVRNNLIARTFPLIGKSKLSYFHQNLHGSWWNETGKKGKPRGLIQAISEESLNEAEEKFRQEFKVDPKKASRNIFFQLANYQIKKPGIKYFADSTPVNIMQAKYLFELFPEAKFLNLVRDGRDVAISVSTQKWGPSDPYKALDWWANRVLKGDEALRTLPADKQLTLRLENLAVRDRVNSYKRLLDFLGLNSEERLDTFFENEVIEDRLNEGSWKSKVDNPVKFEQKYLKVLEKLAENGIVIERYY